MSMFHRMRCGLAGVSMALASFCSAQTITPQEHARRANEYLKAKQPEKAIPEFAALVAADPNNVDAEANLGVLLYFQGRFTEAEGPLRKAVELQPELAKIRGLLGLCEYQMGHLDAARGDLWGALNGDLDPKFHREVGLTLVEVDTARNDLPSAAVTIGKLLETAPADPEILYAAYRVHSDLAGEALLSLSLAAPKSGQMQQAIAHELERVRDLPGAIANFRKAIAANPNLPGVHFELAEALHGSDSQEIRAQAEAEYRIALAKNPHEVQAAVRLGDLAADRSDMVGARGFYERALKDQPGNAEAAIGLARVYSEQNENDKALPLLLDALKADPTNMLAHFRLSALYRTMKRPEDAKRELAEYQRYKAMKEGLRQVYGAMKIEAPHGAADDAGAAH
ncbi:Tetratricopeptide repeat-containing protein [Granulicella pectinivorans]|uniref:Tetratricopeptide repeat-containing protein n=2 Tax=Granulicella pectinivorans TaxID=474950 RepID=A0A1I6MY58_9BACT|nr:Tetratricopeptide repeat-containing protein [Granulicella pectinivorans]